MRGGANRRAAVAAFESQRPSTSSTAPPKRRCLPWPAIKRVPRNMSRTEPPQGRRVLITRSLGSWLTMRLEGWSQEQQPA